jgi:hypothetical protein
MKFDLKLNVRLLPVRDLGRTLESFHTVSHLQKQFGAKPFHIVFLGAVVGAELHELFDGPSLGAKVTINPGITATDEINFRHIGLLSMP